MKTIRAWLIRLKGIVPNRRRQREFDEELASHLEMHVEDNLRAGMSEEEARRDARMKLGVESTTQAYRERGTIPFFETFMQDLRFALRQLARYPAFAFTAVLVLSLGMGASVAIFSFVEATLLKPLPYEAPNRLVHVTGSVAEFPRGNLSYLDFLDWKKMNQVFRSLDAFNEFGFGLKDSRGVELVPGTRVSAGFFNTLGVSPMLGRNFHDGEDQPGNPESVILSYGAWQKRYGKRADIIGQTVVLNDTPTLIVGVLPKDFHFAPVGDAEFWTTLRGTGFCEKRRSCHNLEGVARLKDGVTVEGARANMTAIAKQLERQFPDSNGGQGASVESLSEVIVGDVRPILLVLLAGAGLLQVIAGVNVVSLLLVRFEGRRREIAVRGALGASVARLVRQFVTEAFVLVAVSTVFGLAASFGGMKILLHLLSKEMLAKMPYLQQIGMNRNVLIFAAALALISLAMFSLAPVLRLSSREMRDDLNESSRSASGRVWRRLGSNLVVVELAVAMVLLVGAGLLGKSFYKLLHVELAFEPDHLAVLTIAAPDSAYGKQEQAVALGQEIERRFKTLPSVVSVGLTSRTPVSGNGNTEWIRVVGAPFNGEHNEVNQRDVSAKYFTTLKARLMRGRFFTESDNASAKRVIIVNQTFANKYFPGEDPIGKKLADPELTEKSIREVVGVVDDIREAALDSEIMPAEYYPFNQSPDTFVSVVVRTSQPEEFLLPTLSSTIRGINPDLATINETSMLRKISATQTAYLHRSSAWLVGGFAMLALLLGTVGLYGVIAYSVSQRTREIGVRMALGAQRGSVYQLILSEAGRLTAVGIAAGLLCSIAGASLLKTILFKVHSWDLTTLVVVAVVLTIAATLASFLPARRAASVNPMEALRME
jgi:macrolide transport system ATP-binding/permease protein